MKKSRGKYLLGAPLTAAGFHRSAETLRSEIPEEKQLEILANYVNLNTNKTIGVLGTGAIVFAAISALYSFLPTGFVLFSSSTCALGVLILLSNLWSSWRRDNIDFYLTTRSFVYILELLASRMIRLSIATLLVAAALISTLFGILFQQTNLDDQAYALIAEIFARLQVKAGRFAPAS